MGCDIHDYCEVRKNGAWTPTGDVFPYPYFRADEPADVLRCWTEVNGKGQFSDGLHPSLGVPCNEDCYVPNPRLCPHPYKRRHYDLFAILADVRNGRGFAGCDTGDGFVPIAQPKGLPTDVSPEVKAHSDRWGVDGHSHSWLTVAELDAYDWTRTTKHRGWVDPWNFGVWRKSGKPESWSGGVHGGNIKHVSNAEVAKRIDGGDIVFDDAEPGIFGEKGYTTEFQRSMRKVGLGDMPKGTVGRSIADEGDWYYTLVEWEEKYADTVKSFLTETMPRLRELGPPEDVRLVFWFDN